MNNSHQFHCTIKTQFTALLATSGELFNIFFLSLLCFLRTSAERGATGELLELAVGKDDMVLGFIRPEYRPFTDFSVA
ncbi:MAG: element excision factor XisI family protein [Dolichospermum sp.]